MAAAARDVKLLGARPSPFVNRVQFALNLKSIGYEFIPTNPMAKTELLLKSNPVHKKIPVFFHGDKTICESLVIVQYIDEAFPDGPCILPSDPYDRSTARFWAAYIDDKWYPLIRSLRDANEESKAEIVEKISEGVKLLEDAFVKLSDGKGFFGGDTIGYVDIALGCFLGWLKVHETISNQKVFDEANSPALLEWTERFMNHEAVKGTLPETEELFNIVKMMQAAAAAAKAAAESEASK